MKTTKKIAGHVVALALTVIGLCAATGCGVVQPYERGKLAHPTMNDAVSAGPAAEHVYAVHEGATGGGSVAESGCGCN